MKLSNFRPGGYTFSTLNTDILSQWHISPKIKFPALFKQKRPRLSLNMGWNTPAKHRIEVRLGSCTFTMRINARKQDITELTGEFNLRFQCGKNYRHSQCNENPQIQFFPKVILAISASLFPTLKSSRMHLNKMVELRR